MANLNQIIEDLSLLDEISLIEILEIDSGEIIERFPDKVEMKASQLEECELDYERQQLTGTQND